MWAHVWQPRAGLSGKLPREVNDMVKSILLPSALLVLTTSLAACGNNRVQSDVATQPETTTQPMVKDVKPGIIYAADSQKKLFTAQKADGSLDFKLYKQDVRTGATTAVGLPIPNDALVIGAALQDTSTAYVATRATTDGVERDTFYRVNLITDDTEQVLRSSPEHFAATEINSLSFQDGVLRFFAMRPITVQGQPETELGLFRLEGTQVTAVATDSAETRIFQQALTKASARDLAAQSMSAQAVTFLRFPKTVSAHRTSGSPYHTGQDAYAADLNTGGGDDDLGHGVVAAQYGQVVSSSNVGSGYGEYIQIRLNNGLTTAYAHLAKRVVYAGNSVYIGQYIGNVGKSGGQASAHLHFVLRNGTTPMQISSATYPMATSGGGYSCPLTRDMPFNVEFRPASC